MLVQVLAVTDCPNVALLDQRLDEVLADQTDVRVEHLTIDDPAEAARWGMSGSPTLLVDGVDPFAVLGLVPSVSCRLYRGPDGAVTGAPSRDELRAVLEPSRRSVWMGVSIYGPTRL